ncbi:TNF receptor-associated factor-like 1a [Vitis vinifera]|uniref:TNF receptor-associated factor-like 1a n=1 Tax=Vitis vinifera TaxID=29760 RepID=A0A438F8C0_VITVI|nr:TNF receptor-associated factor-like 1a [Vitis vinifera]
MWTWLGLQVRRAELVGLQILFQVGNDASREKHWQNGGPLSKWKMEPHQLPPPYWDSDDPDDTGAKPSELYGKYTWKIEKFSQINKRELRSNAFEVGGYKWFYKREKKLKGKGESKAWTIVKRKKKICSFRFERELRRLECFVNYMIGKAKVKYDGGHCKKLRVGRLLGWGAVEVKGAVGGVHAKIFRDYKGVKRYILIYPQGCDVCNHLSLFLCVANHDKLLPGWSHFAQFTIAVVNKDPKKSKYSDTLHRFWKKEHDWGWKKFMELSKVLDGFIDADTLIIKAQVQVIRERADRPFRCLDCQYRRELVRVYLTNVEQICRRFVEERRGKLGKLIEDKARWSSFCAFWLGIDQNARRRMSREKTDSILKVVVKHFFIEKEVTSTLVMDSLYSGLKALEGQTNKSKKGRVKLLDAEEMPAPIVRVEKDMFVLVDDVLLLLERAALEPLPPKDEKGPQNRTKAYGAIKLLIVVLGAGVLLETVIKSQSSLLKCGVEHEDGGPGEDFNKDSIERDERRLTELGRRTVEIFVLAHIFR